MPWGARIVILFVCCIFITVSPTALAFKPKTHVWIAQQVLNDLEDGQLEFEINGVVKRYPLDSITLASIRGGADVYRMGHIGPDAGPDIYAGQMAIHPGTESFGTDKWAMALNDYVLDLSNHQSDEAWYQAKDKECEGRTYDLDEIWGYINDISGDSDTESSGSYLTAADEMGLLDTIAEVVNRSDAERKSAAGYPNPTQLAYLKGFLGHIAGDVFAHSYVNHYAGDVFSLANGEMETEKRHAAIESYIDQKLPPLPQGHEYNLIRNPSKFLAEAFIFNEAMASKFGSYRGVDGQRREGGATYLYAISKLRNGVRNAASSCTWTAIDRFAMQIAIGAWTGYYPSENQIKAVNKIQDKLHGLTSDVKQGIGSAHNDLNKAVTSLHRKNFKHLNEIVGSFESGVDEFNSFERQLIDLENKIHDEIVGKVCDFEKKVSCGLSLSCRIAQKNDLLPGCAANSAYKEAVRLREKIIAERDSRTDGIVSGLRADLKELEEAMIAIHDLSAAMTDTIVRISDFSSDISPFRQALRRWDEDIKEAMVAWVEANGEVVRNSMVEGARSPSDSEARCFKLFVGNNCGSDDFTKPISDWVDIYAQVFVGIPADIGKIGNQMQVTMDSVSSFVNGKVRRDLLNVSSPFTRMAILDLEKFISEELSDFDMTEEVLNFVGNEEWSDTYKNINTIFSAKIDKPLINSIFKDDHKNIGLITYPRFTDVMDNDMGIVPGSSKAMDWKKFPALYNAVTLSKLALLNSTQLSDLGKSLAMPYYTVYGSVLYKPKTCKIQQTREPGKYGAVYYEEVCTHRSNENILYYAIKNIDGHQSWMGKSDPLPRIGSTFSNSFAMLDDNPEYPPLVYGYGRDQLDSGFRFWEVGEQYFNKIFKMPLFDYEDKSAVERPPRCGTKYVSACNYGISYAFQRAHQYCGICGVEVNMISNQCGDIVCRD